MAVNLNGISAVYTPDGGSGITMKVTSHSESGSSRPDIDITDSSDTHRVVLPGLAEAEKHTFEVVLTDATERSSLTGLLDDCASGALVVQYTPCGGSATNLINISAWCTAVTMTGELDGAFTASLEFTRDRSG